MNRRRVARIGALVLLTSVASCVDKLVGADPTSAPSAVFDMIWSDFDQQYAGFEQHHVDWNDVYRRYKPRADSAQTLGGVADVIGAMFRELHDPHVDLSLPNHAMYPSVDFKTIHTYWNTVATVANYAPSSVMSPSRNIRYGKVASDIGWIWIGSFGGKGWSDEIDTAIDALAGVTSIIVDVRNNGGGSTNNSDPIAGRFLSNERITGYVQYRNGPGHADFTPLRAVTVGPQGRHFTGRVVVLINRFCASATESFALAMRTQPGVTFVGDTTIGAFSDPLVRELANGWMYRVPHGNRLDPSHVSLETIGIAPDVFVRITPADSIAGRDPQLERAMLVAREN